MDQPSIYVTIRGTEIAMFFFEKTQYCYIASTHRAGSSQAMFLQACFCLALPIREDGPVSQQVDYLFACPSLEGGRISRQVDCKLGCPWPIVDCRGFPKPVVPFTYGLSYRPANKFLLDIFVAARWTLGGSPVISSRAFLSLFPGRL